jgi:hypothetical protein
MNLIPFKKKPMHVPQVATLADGKEAFNSDKNKDGIPDYLQRENYASIINSNKDFIKWESDPEIEIEQYIMGLKGYDFDVRDNVWKPVSPPILNKAGISYIKTMLRAVINKHSINTFLSSDEVHTICLSHTAALVDTLTYRKNLYGIDLADLDSIVESFDNLCFIILSRSIGDKQRDHNTNRLKISQSVSGNQNERM